MGSTFLSDSFQAVLAWLDYRRCCMKQKVFLTRIQQFELILVRLIGEFTEALALCDEILKKDLTNLGMMKRKVGQKSFYLSSSVVNIILASDMYKESTARLAWDGRRHKRNPQEVSVRSWQLGTARRALFILSR